MDGVTSIGDCKIIRRCDLNVNGCLFSGLYASWDMLWSPCNTELDQWKKLDVSKSIFDEKSQSDSITCLPSVSVFISK